MADVTGRIGDQDVALDNAATEATLRALLLATAGSQKNMDRLLGMATKAGLDPKSINNANNGLADLARVGAGDATKSLTGMSKGMMILGGIVGDLAIGAFKTAGNLTDFAGKLMDGTATISGFYASLKDLPFGLGLIAGLFERIAKYAESNLVVYQNITKAGLNFGGSLTDMRVQMAGVYLTLDEFQAVVAKNADVFVGLGANANEGGQAFLKINRTLTNSSSALGNELRALGYTFREINDLTGSYIRVRGGLTKQEAADTEMVAKKVAAYGKELDTITQLTGQSRELQQQILEEEMNEANFKAYMATLSEKDREALQASLTKMTGLYGKAGADIVKSAALGIGPQTDAGRLLMATSKSAADSIAKDAELRKRYGNESNEVLQNEANGRIAAQRDLGKFTGVVGVASGVFKDLAPVINQNTKEQQAGIKTQKDYIDNVNKIRENQEKQSKSLAADTAKAQAGFKEVGAGLVGAFAPAMEKLVPIVNNMAEKFAQFIKNNIPMLEENLTKLATWFGNFMENMFTPEGRQKIIDDIGELLSKLLKGIFGSGMNESVKKQAEINYEQKTIGDKLESLPAIAIEKLGYLLGNVIPGLTNLTERAEKARIESEAEELRKRAGKRATGSLGMTGRLFENFGSGTLMELHGLETVMTPDQVNDLLKAGNSANLVALQKSLQNKTSDPLTKLSEWIENLGKSTVDPNQKSVQLSSQSGLESLVTEMQTLNKQTSEMLRFIKESTEYTRRNVDAVKGLQGNLYI